MKHADQFLRGLQRPSQAVILGGGGGRPCGRLRQSDESDGGDMWQAVLAMKAHVVRNGLDVYSPGQRFPSHAVEEITAIRR